MKKLLFILLITVFIYTNTNAQPFSKFSIAAGPVFGWNFPNVNDLNTELKKAGMNEFKKDGAFGSGGGGFIDVPLVKGLRIGGYGYGYKQSAETNFGTYSKIAELSYSSAFLSIEYSMKITKRINWTIGGMAGIGSTSLKLSNYSGNFSNWNISNYLNDTTSSGSHVLNFKTNSYSFMPQAGIGWQPLGFLYFKLNAGYLFTFDSQWKIDDLIEAKNFPTGIKAGGPMINFGVYLGLFVD